MSDHRSSDAGLLETLGVEDETLRAGNRQSSGSHSNEWLVNVADDVVVPMVTSEVVEALRAGRLTNRSLVWRIGMHDWSVLAEVPQLRLAAGPSALPPAASTPGPVVHRSLVPPEHRPRTTLPFGLPAVAKPKEDSGALAVYERPAAELTFADSVRAEWQGSGRIVNQNAPVPPAARARLTPVPPVASRLAPRSARPQPTNTLAPITAESNRLSASRAPNPWGDLSVVLASELRAEKKATKRLVVWAAVGSAVAASVFTFWVARSVSTSGAPVPALAAAPQLTVPAREAEPEHAAPELSAAAPTAPSSAPAAVPKPAVAIVAKVRTVRRTKPAKVLAPKALEAETPSATDTSDSASEPPNAAATLPLAAPLTAAAPAAEPNETPAPPAAPPETPPAPATTSGS